MTQVTPGRSYLLMGPPGSGKSTMGRQALEAKGNGLIALAPGMEEFASYRKFHNRDGYIIEGFDDPDFFPTMGSTKVEGYDKMLGWLRGVRAALQKRLDANEPLPYTLLVTDTFNQFAGLAMNKTLNHLGVTEPPPAMSPSGAAFWGYQRQLCDQLMRACRTIKGMGLDWIAMSHVSEKEMKESSIAQPDRAEDTKQNKVGLVPAVSGGFRDVMAGGFDLVLHCGALRQNGKPVHYLKWMPSDRRPTKNRYGALAEADKIKADWNELQTRLEALDKEDAK